jgi:hypothetical protein
MIRRVAAAVAVLALAALAATPVGLARWRCLSMEKRLAVHKCCKPTAEEAAQARLGGVCCEREADRSVEPILTHDGDGAAPLAAVTLIAALPVGTLAPPVVALPTARGRGSPPPPLRHLPTDTIVLHI